MTTQSNHKDNKTLSPTKRALLALKESQTKLKALEQAKNEPIAIVGLACRFPGGADNPDAFWDLLANAKNGITEVPATRWHIGAFYDPTPQVPGKMYTRYGGFINEVTKFDARFFNISGREAVSLDPQQRLLLEMSWEALENAGQAPHNLFNTPTGVFVGLCNFDNALGLSQKADIEVFDVFAGTGNALSAAAGRVSYTLGLTGPSLAVDTACSSSLVAIHLACQSLRSGECNLALAGGVNILLVPEVTIGFCQASAMAPDGQCRTFSNQAKGYVRSEGSGMIVLKRLSQAKANGDRILAVIRGSAVNQDGPSGGLTVPSGPSQEKVIKQALTNANVDPKDIDYVEAHGTGTSLGDPIEVGALGNVFGLSRPKETPLLIGSAKTNIGHLESAAGMVGLIKVVLSLQNQKLPPHLHFNEPNSRIPWPELPIEVVTRLKPWPKTDKPRLAGVSSFGLSGTNAHLILEEAPTVNVNPALLERTTQERTTHLFTLSAKSENALQWLVARYIRYLRINPELNIADICFTANTGRSHFKYRMGIVAHSSLDLQEKLIAFKTKQSVNGVYTNTLPTAMDEPKIGFIFTAENSTFVGVGYSLYKSSPIFKRVLDECSEILHAYLPQAMLSILYPNLELEKPTETQLETTPTETLPALEAYTQPILFSLQYALAKMWLSWGIKPAVVMGHGLGEYVAACLAGALNLETALKLITSSNLETALAEIDNKPLLMPFICNITGDLLTVGHILETDYWKQATEQQIDLNQKFSTLLKTNYNLFLELSLESALNMDSLKEAKGLILPSLLKDKDDWTILLSTLSVLYTQGVKVDWLGVDRDYVRQKLSLPTYPFERKYFWLEEKMRLPQGVSLMEDEQRISILKEKLHPQITSIAAKALRIAVEDVDTQMSFLDMGAASIVLMDMISKIDQDYGIKLAIRQLFEELGTVDDLTDYVANHVPSDWQIEGVSVATPSANQLAMANVPAPLATQANVPSTPVSISLPPATTTPLPPSTLAVQASVGQNLPVGDNVTERILREQLQTMSRLMSEQLNFLHGNGQPVNYTPQTTMVSNQPPAIQEQIPSSEPVVSNVDLSDITRSMTDEANVRSFPPEQQAYIDEFSKQYTERTQKSKAYTDQYRPVWADIRSTMVFRPELKELCYTLVAEKSAGSKIWDIDGNEYVDISMGFGVHLFGHSPSFVMRALLEQLKKGMQIGPQTDKVGEVSSLITKFTGLERVTYANSGTEAVMAAIRIARAATGREKIVIFTDSYHGHSDATLAIAKMVGGQRVTVPWVPGVPQEAVDSIIVLDYGEPEALETIKKHSSELAAVLVEPVQSRRPGLQPKEFLQELRQITTEADVALIFDEIITGFRIHPGGAQAWFGIQADIATYGKIIGGGMPIGIVAGKPRFLDKIDGGMWQYGDSSYPPVVPSFAAGTFCKHPLAVASIGSVLKHLEKEGMALYDDLNKRANYLVESVNQYFKQQSIPIRTTNFGSLFRFTMGNNFSYLYQPLEMDLFFYHLIQRGLYVWEGRTCFLSTAHTDEDVEYIIKAVTESADVLNANGFFGKKSQLAAKKKKPSVIGDSLNKKPVKVPTNTAQKQLWLGSQMGQDGTLASKMICALKINGPLDLKLVQETMQTIVNRHEALRTTLSEDGDFQIIAPSLTIDTPLIDFCNINEDEQDAKIKDWFVKQSLEAIDLCNGPLFKVSVLKLNMAVHILVFEVHHAVVDGWSMEIILQEFGQIYALATQGRRPDLAHPVQFREFMQWQIEQMKSKEMADHEAYWLAQFKDDIPLLLLPTDHPRPKVRTYDGAKQSKRLGVDISQHLKQVSRENGWTLFMTVLGVYTALLHQLCKQESFVIGVPTGGRFFEGKDSMVGYCAHLLAIYSVISNSATIIDHINTLKVTLLDAFKHQAYPFSELLNKLNLPRNPSLPPMITGVFNLEVELPIEQAFDLDIDLMAPPVSYVEYDLELNVIQVNNEIQLDFHYNTHLFEAKTIEQWLYYLEILLKRLFKESKQPVAMVYEALEKETKKEQQLQARAKFKKLRRQKVKRS